MDAAGLLRMQYLLAHNVLEGTMAELTTEQAHWTPDGQAMPVAAHYGHIITGEDSFLRSVLQIGAPLLAGAWAGRTGLSEVPPIGPWNEWAARVQVDLAAAREYAQAVYAATDAYLAGLSADDLERALDLSSLGLGAQTVGSFLSLLLCNVAWHTGEIAAAKGLQGLQGYPF